MYAILLPDNLSLALASVRLRAWRAGGRGLRNALTPQAQRALIRSGSKRAEALEALTAQVADLQNTLQVKFLELRRLPFSVSSSLHVPCQIAGSVLCQASHRLVQHQMPPDTLDVKNGPRPASGLQSAMCCRRIFRLSQAGFASISHLFWKLTISLSGDAD